jgi:hypothetical protein
MSQESKQNTKKEPWQVQKLALQKKFGDTGWNPRKKLSPDALDGIRALRAQYPNTFTTEVLAEKFEVSPEAIRRILKSKWRPTEEEQTSRRERWEKRGEKIWMRYAELGMKPPKKWRELGVGKLEYENRRNSPSVPRRRKQDSVPWASSVVATHSKPRMQGYWEGESLSDRIL